MIPSGAMRSSSSWRRHVARLALALALGGAAAALPPPGDRGRAEAAVSILMTLDELVASSSRVVLAEPLERTSRWEVLGGGKRIVTYTRLAVSEPVAGAGSSEVWVRTLGGAVDGIGQHVAGEATFQIGERSLVFLEAAPDGATVVTGMAQGHYRLAEVEGEIVLRPSPDAGTLLPRRGPSIAAREVLAGARLDRARAAVVEAWKRRGQDRPGSPR
jgi:hypothetical protein